MKSENGRSMVEMLGVLAIIGVLSVGAIASYSKAMMKYKLNKQAESFNTLLNNAIELYPALTRTYAVNKFNYSQGIEWLLRVFKSLNLIPDGMVAKENYIEDVFKNKIQFTYYNGGNGATNEYLMAITLNRNSKNQLTEIDRQICHTYVNVAKGNADNLAFISMRSGYQTPSGDTAYNYTALYGEKNPKGNLLSKAGVKEIDDFCSYCNSEKYCQLFIYLAITKNQ